MLVGNAGGTYTLTATSSLGVISSGVSGGSAGMLTSWLTGNTLTATSAPTASYFTATSSNATSTFPRLSVSSGVSLMGEYFENFTNYTRSLFTAGNGLSLSSGQYSVNSSELSNNSLVSWNGSNFVATGTPQLTVGTILATSTTATSTFSGNIRVAGNAQVDGSLFCSYNFHSGNGVLNFFISYKSFNCS